MIARKRLSTQKQPNLKKGAAHAKKAA